MRGFRMKVVSYWRAASTLTLTMVVNLHLQPPLIMFKITIGTKKPFSISKGGMTATGEISASRVSDNPEKVWLHVHILDTGGIRVQDVIVQPATDTQRYFPIGLLNSENAWELALNCKWLIQDLFMTSEQPIYQS